MKWEEYKSRIKEGLDSFNFDEEILDILKDSIKNNQTIFIAGNGGSAAIASHYACDLSKGANKKWDSNFKRYKAINLSGNISYLTAIANDTQYSEIFKQQLINLAEPKDILMLISSSGNSPDIIEAAKYGKDIGMIVIGICGFDGGKLKQIADYYAHVNVNSYEISEDIHHIFGHFIAQYLREGK